MQPRINQLLSLLFVVLVAVPACRLDRLAGGQGPAPPPSPTLTTNPSPTPFPLPPAHTATPTPQPTPTNTLVIQRTDTPESPPTDTPTPAPPTSEPTSTDTPVPEPSPTETLPEPVGNGTKIDWDDADGQPNVISGQDVGYFVWTDGDRVHIRVLTDGSRQIFSGQAIGNGAIVRVDPLAQEGIEVTIPENVNQMAFQWATAGGPEGLDFTFTGNTLQLNLRIDNQPEPEFVFVGADKLTLVNGLPLQLVR
jgi:hypothetical protein